MIGARRNRGGGLWWAFLLFFTGLLFWGLFWGIPGLDDAVSNVPLALLISKTGAMTFPGALLYVYLVLGWACVGISVIGLAILLGPGGAKRRVAGKIRVGGKAARSARR